MVINPLLIACLLVAGLGLELTYAQPTETVLATITPCLHAVEGSSPRPIIVTEQYQPVSTCVPLSEMCIRNKCWTHYTYSTYDFVLTVIPCPSGSPSTVSTITETEQSVRVSRLLTTIANPVVTSFITESAKRHITIVTTSIIHTTVVKEWSAPYKNLGPFAIAGYMGSGICTNCLGPGGQNVQSLDVLECLEISTERNAICRQYPEVWMYITRPPISRTISTVCSTQTSLSSAGVYTFRFPYRIPSSTISIPTQVVSYFINSKLMTSVKAPITSILSETEWIFTITRTYTEPTLITIQTAMTKTLAYAASPLTFPSEL